MRTPRVTDELLRAAGGDLAGPGAPRAARAEPDRRLTALADVEFAHDTSLSSVLRQVAEVATELLPCSGGASVVMWDGDRDAFALGASTVPSQDGNTAASRLRSRGGVTRWIVEHREAHVVPDISTDPLGGNAMPGEYGIRAYAGMPMVADGESLGVLYALDTAPRHYGASDLALLRKLAGRAATAIANARMLDESRAARERAEALAWVANALIAAEGLHEVLQSVVEGAAAALQAERVELVTVDLEARRVLERFTGGMAGVAAEPVPFTDLVGGIIGWVLREERVALSRSLGEDEREPREIRGSWVAQGIGPAVVAPLRYGTHVLGTLSVLRRVDQVAFTEPEVDLVIAMSSQAAVAIENVRLVEATRSTLRETEVLFSVSQALTEVDTPEQVLEVVASGAVDVLPAGRVVVHAVSQDPAIAPLEAAAGPDKMPGFDFAQVLSGGSLERLRDGRPVITSPAVADAAPGVVAPLKVHDRLLGAVAAAPIAGRAEFGPRQTELLMTLAAHAAAALDGARLLEEVQRLAVTDELTGAHNRRHLFELAEHEFRQASRYVRPLAAIMFDIDRFKDINDRYGHAIGDLVLRWVADHCRAVIREADVWGRYGGEEFAVVLPETGLKGASELAERLRARVADAPISTPRGPIPVTISLGVAELQEAMRDVHALIDRADAAMYFAKRTGRNRVESA